MNSILHDIQTLNEYYVCVYYWHFLYLAFSLTPTLVCK